MVKYTWKKVSGKWYYIDSNGSKVTGFARIDGSVYYFSSKGVMLTGWQKADGKWYYFLSGGNAASGWKKISGKWYYFSASDNCVMVTGLQTIDGKRYYFKSSGAMQPAGWFNLGNKTNPKWYYAGKDGSLLTGMWIIGKDLYLFDNSGLMVRNASVSGLYFGSDGRCINW